MQDMNARNKTTILIALSVVATLLMPSQGLVAEDLFAEEKQELKPIIRKIGLNLEPVVARGDIQILYETLTDQDLSYLLQFHVNPHPVHKEETGSFGLMAGARLYLDSKNNGFFGQALVGMNNESSGDWAPAIQLGGGYTYPWKRNISVEGGAYFNRNYDAQTPRSAFNVVLAISLGLDHKLTPWF